MRALTVPVVVVGAARFVRLLLYSSLLLATCAVSDPTWRIKYLTLDVGTVPYMQTIYDWQNLTGGVVEVVSRSVGPLQKELKQDLDSDHIYDLYQKSTAWPIFTYAEAGTVEDLTNDVRTMESLEWTAISAVQRKIATSYLSHTYSIPIDADPLVYYYRRDLLKRDPPSTWEDMIEIAASFHGTDLNGDGVPDYGVCIVTESYMHVLLMTIANTVYRHAASKREHFLYDVPNDVDPAHLLLDTEGWEYVFNILKSLYQYSQKRRLTNTYADAQTLFFTGRCASIIFFGSLGAMTVDNTGGKNGTFMRGKMGVSRTPGSRLVYDRTTKRLQPCTSQLCAFQEYGNVNRPNFMGGGAQIMLRKGTPNRAAALSFAAYFSTHVDVRSPGSNNPFRSSHYDPVEYTKSRPVAWDYDDAKLYTTALYDTLNRDTTATLPATKNADIIATLLASAAEEYIRLAQYENYTTNATEILARTQTDILQEGEANACGVDVVDRNIRIHLELPLRSVAGKSSNTATTSLAIIVPLVILSAAVAVAYVKLRPHWAARRAPKDAAKPFGTMFVALKSETVLWERYPTSMPKITEAYCAVIRKCCAASGCHEVKMIGGAVMLVAKQPQDMLQCAREIAKEFFRNDLSSLLKSKETAAPNATNSHRATPRHHDSAHQSRNNSETESTHEKDPTTSQGSTGSSRTGGIDRAHEIAFGIGVHWSTGRIHYHEATSTYDYSGPSVEGAAIASDAACGHQILVSQDVDHSSLPDNQFSEFCTREVNHRATAMLQYSPPGLPLRQFVCTASQELAVDSLASAIEQQSMGVTSKRATVLYVRLHDFYALACSKSRESVAEDYSALLAEIQGLVDGEKGYLQSFCGGHIIVTFNAVASTPQQQVRACGAALLIVAAAKKAGVGRVTCGVVSSMSLVGSFTTAAKGTHCALLSNAVEQAALLERMCCLYPDGAEVLTDSAFFDELSMYYVVRMVDVARLPNNKQVTGVVRVIERRSAQALDEWMYELQRTQTTDVNGPVNLVFLSMLKELAGNEGKRTQVDVAKVTGEAQSYLGVPTQIMSRFDGDVAAYIASKAELYRLFTDAPPDQDAPPKATSF